MGLQRRSQFGYAPPPNRGSTQTSRLVPLTAAVEPGQPWPTLPPGSSTSAVNFMAGPDQFLVPRSRLSSLNTIRAPGSAAVVALTPFTYANFANQEVWYSGNTVHGVIGSNGSISQASFVSALGMGHEMLGSQFGWQFAHGFSSVLDENVIVAVGMSSAQTPLVLFRENGASNGVPLFSFLPNAPRSMAIGAFDSYVLVGALVEDGLGAASRIRWCKRGDLLAWTGEGAGFEDLLEMRGDITAIKPSTDGRVIVFGNAQIWQGVPAAYPQQFQFTCLEQNIGCPFALTIQHTDAGLVFLGSDLQLRVFEYGGRSRPFAPSLTAEIRDRIDVDDTALATWGMYDPYYRRYYLFYDNAATAANVGIAVNVDTGAWTHLDYPGITAGLTAGVAITRDDSVYAATEGLLFANSTGTIYSTSSKLGTENGSVVTATWRSAPIGSELPGNYKQLTQFDIDYRATSRATLRLKISQDGGNTYESTGQLVSLPVALSSARATAQVYAGGALPTIELSSSDTGYEIHRIDATFNVGGRRA